MSLSSKRKETLRKLFAAQHDVRAAYLFGSAATGTERPASDLDLAILLPHGQQLSSERTLDFHAAPRAASQSLQAEALRKKA